jgi:archaellum biogenesis ATPase FlaH
MDEREWVESTYPEAKWTGAEAMVRCRFHDDRTASCSINIEKGVFFCHSCKKKGTLHDLGYENGQRRIAREITYDYQDESGRLAYQVVRGTRDGAKTFWQRRSDGRGGWINGTKGLVPLPFRLPDLLAAIGRGEPVFVTEGEKDCETLRAWGLTATTNHGGAGKWKEEHSKWFPPGTMVVVVGDADEPGQAHVRSVTTQLTARGCTVKVVDLGYEVLGNHGKDVSDWKAEGHGKQDLEALIAEAQTVEEPTYAQTGIRDFLEAPPVSWLIEGVLYDGSLSLLASYAGRGKSLLALAMAQSVASGDPLFNQFAVSRTGPVLYVDEENGQSDIKARIEAMRIHPDLPITWIHMKCVQIDDDESLGLLKATIRKVQPALVVLDSLVRLHRAKENDAVEMAAVMGRCRQLVAERTSVLIIHHHNKGSGVETMARGSSDIVAAVDVEYQLTEREGELVLATVKNRREAFQPIRLKIRNDDGELYSAKTRSTISAMVAAREASCSFSTAVSPLVAFMMATTETTASGMTISSAPIRTSFTPNFMFFSILYLLLLWRPTPLLRVVKLTD